MLQAHLYFFAGCAVLGMLPVAVIAAKGPRRFLAVLAVLFGAGATLVFIAAAVRLR